MKKTLRRLLCGFLAVLLLTGRALALSSKDTLITLSYLTQLFLPQALDAGEEAAGERLQDAYDEASDDLDKVQEDLLEQASGENGLYSGSLALRDWSDGQVIQAATGSGFLLGAGKAAVSHNGAVIDVTEGAEVPAGTALTAGHRYLVGEDTTAQVTILSGAAQLGVEGSYTRTGGKKNPTPFYDVSQLDWYYAPVAYVYENGLFAGMSEHEFGPSSVMSRAMVMTVFFNLAGAPMREMEGATATFEDAPEGAWFTPYVRWAATQGITAGTGPTTFSPDLKINREQMVLLLYAFGVGYLEMDLSARADLTVYEDHESVSVWARDAMSWAVAEGIIGSGTTLNPRGDADRATVAAMLKVFSEEVR